MDQFEDIRQVIGKIENLHIMKQRKSELEQEIHRLEDSCDNISMEQDIENAMHNLASESLRDEDFLGLEESCFRESSSRIDEEETNCLAEIMRKRAELARLEADTSKLENELAIRRKHRLWWTFVVALEKCHIERHRHNPPFFFFLIRKLSYGLKIGKRLDPPRSRILARFFFQKNQNREVSQNSLRD